jgi:proline iminopeptidase
MRALLSRRRIIGLAAAAAISARAASRARTVGVDESGFVPIGGIDQWIAVRGRDADDPVIVYLHGGPGEAQSPFLEEFLPWERSFTVVNWDQRGSGKTYGKYGASTPGMATAEKAVESLTRDAIAVAEYAQRRLRKRKIILVGQSWGSILGLLVAKRRPDLFHAYVGTGFEVSWSLSTQARESWARSEAQRTGDRATLNALDAASALPISDMRRIVAGSKYLMAPLDIEYLTIQGKFVGKPPLPSKGDVADWVAGGAFSVARLLPAITSFDARKFGLDFAVPFFVIQGRDDHITSYTAAKAYVAAIHAPRKAFIPIDGGHFACFTDPAGFVGALQKCVRPVALRLQLEQNRASQVE